MYYPVSMLICLSLILNVPIEVRDYFFFNMILCLLTKLFKIHKLTHFVTQPYNTYKKDSKHFAYFLFYTQTKHIHYLQKTDTSGFKEIPNNTNMLNTSHNKDCTPHNLEILKQATLSIRIDYILKPNYEYTT